MRAEPSTVDTTQTALTERYLEHARVQKRLAPRTLALYSEDLHKLMTAAAQAGIALTAVQNHHVRRWVAQMHAGGRSGRGIALILSGWRGFYTWLGREGQISANPVQDVRAPRQARPLPKALGVDEAVQLADHVAEDDDPWLEARDAAMVELLYGSGLRVGELVGLDVAASDAAQRAGRGEGHAGRGGIPRPRHAAVEAGRHELHRQPEVQLRQEQGQRQQLELRQLRVRERLQHAEPDRSVP